MNVGSVGQHAVRARAVVVGDEHIDAAGARGGHLLDGGDRAVHGDQQLRAAFDQPIHGRRGEPVTLRLAVRQVPVDVCAQLTQRADEDRGGAHAIAVVVAVHGDRRAARE